MPALFRRFVSITGWQPWKSRLESLSAQMEKNQFIGEYFADRYALEIEMERTRRHLSRTDKLALPETAEQTALYALIVTVAHVYGRLSKRGQIRLRGMLRHCLKSDPGLVPLQHEMEMAVQLMSRGFDVEFSDLEGSGEFDFLCRADKVDVEFECKTFSGDVGRKIHRRRLYQLAGHIRLAMEDALDRRLGGQLARIILPGRLTGNDEQIASISDRLAKALETGRTQATGDPCTVEYTAFSIEGGPFDKTNLGLVERELGREFIEQQTGIPISHALMMGRPRSGVVAVTVESAQSDSVWNGLERYLKRSAKQLTGTRPGAILVRFTDITESELLEIVEQDRSGEPTALRIKTNELFRRDDWRHVYIVAYMAPPLVTRTDKIEGDKRVRSVRQAGRSYYFRNPKNDLVSDARYDLFADNDSQRD